MASSGKKNKTKWKSVDLANIPNTRITLPRKSSSWADDPELDQNDFEYTRKMDNITLPTAPRAARAEDGDAKIPQNPPYMAYLSNLPYEFTEEELVNYIQDLNVNVKIKAVNLPKEERSSKLKGYGYVEFDDRASFVNIINEYSDLTIKGRRVRLDVSSDGTRGRGMRGGGGSGSEPDYINKDWRASGPPPDRDDDGYKRRDYGDRSGGFGRRDDRRGFGDRDRDRDRGYRDRGGFRDDNREWSRDGDRDRGGGGNWREERGDRDRDRDRDRGSYGRNNYDDRRNEAGSWRRDREDYDRERRSPERSEPKSRPKITLQPRTKPIEETTADTDTSAAAIFGGAKPVNTAAREREIEERLARQSAVDDPPRRKGPSSYDSWDRDRDRARDGDRDRVRGERDQDRDKDRSQDEDDHRKDSYDNYDRKSESDERDIDVDKERVSSRDGESRDVDTPRKLEPAPPPKENVWARRQQSNNSSNSTVNNGRASPSEPDNQSKSRGSSPRPPTKDDSSSGEAPVRKYQPPRGQSSEQRRGDRKPSHDETSKGSSVTGRAATASRPKPVTQGAGRPREQKKDERDEKLRMPKFEEQKAPNFAGSNKYAFLDEANETAAN